MRRLARGQARAAQLIERIEGLRCVDCGRLEMARIAESLTALMISINARTRRTRASGSRACPTTCGSRASSVVVLAGGTGGAKLARGMLDVVGPDELVVIANTGDDIEIYGAHVSPDPDLVSFWLADLIDERGWGLARRHVRGDGRAARARARTCGSTSATATSPGAWSAARMEDEGLRPTEALARLNEAIGVRARVLPMSDEPVRTWVRTDAAAGATSRSS